MKYNPQHAAVVSAEVSMFDYLQEKVGERKTRIEAYCDLMEKASARFVSPFLKKSEQSLDKNQCHVTITDLAAEWKWHRATVRTFLERLEEYRQLTIERLSKSMVITMPSPANFKTIGIGKPTDKFSDEVSHILSEWAVGNITAKEAGAAIGKAIDTCTHDSAVATDNEFSHEIGTEENKRANAPDGKEASPSDEVVRLIVEHAFYSVLAEAADKDTAPLTDFFHEDLMDDWQSVLEAAKVIAELTLNGRSASLDYESKSTQAQFRALCEPFKAILAQGLVLRLEAAAQNIGKKPSQPIV